MTKGYPEPKVLIVDDDFYTWRLIETILRPLRVQVQHAANGQEGVEKTRELRPDLIILDYEMPDFNGLDVLKRLASDEELRAIPVIFATGNDSNRLIATCFDAGAADYVRKPICAPELRARVASVLERQLITRKLETLAYRDTLTGLPNRLALRKQIESALEQRCDQNHAILFLDFDRFKSINDSLGHQAGDELLMQIAHRVQNVLRHFIATTQDSVHAHAGRLGGDEFAVFLEGVDQPEQAERLANVLLKNLSERYILAGHGVSSTASIGLVHIQPALEPRSADDCLRDADTAMYEAKRAGKGRVVVFSPSMQEKVAERLLLETALRESLSRNELYLEYQPIVCLQTGMPRGAEALLRWLHPEKGRISPLDFIPIAEDTGFIIPIGTWVLNESCAAMARWRAELGEAAPESIHVNLSRKQLVPSLTAVVAATLDRHQIPPHYLHLEVTENEIMQDPATATQVMNELRKLGVRMDMDDFGTGHSSLSCLKEFPLDVLKIDRAFLANIDGHHEFTALLHAISCLAKNLNLKVVAEGIETREQLATIQALDCDFGQGYFFARPMREADLIDYVRSQVLASSA